MNRQEVDARVQAAVENLQAGRTVEDDAGIEFKADWPEPTSKARQLAGAANSLRGGRLIYVIGVDDKTGAVTVPKQTEPQDWYAQIRKPFDQIAPELLRVQTVFVGDNSESVLALVFDTSDFPYVVNFTKDVREVPIRVGSGTGSAHRNQLIRILRPTVAVPGLVLVGGTVRAEWTDWPVAPADGSTTTERRLRLECPMAARIFVENVSGDVVTLPADQMHARLRVGDEVIRLDTYARDRSGYTAIDHLRRKERPAPPQHGVYVQQGYVVATAPGEFTLGSAGKMAEGQAPDNHLSDLYAAFESAEMVSLDLAVNVVGIDHSIRLSAALQRVAPVDRKPDHVTPHGVRIETALGKWSMASNLGDPWEDTPEAVADEQPTTGD